MSNKTIDREILNIAIPSIVTNITTPLLGLIDVAIVGHMGAATYIGAIAVGGSMFNMIYWLFGFLRMGSSGMTAQCYGASDLDGQSRILQQGLLMALAAGIAMIALRSEVCTLAIWLMDVEASTATIAGTYFMILIWGAPAVLCNLVLCGWLIGMQNSRATMWVSIFINLSNIAVSCTLVYALHYSIPGVAIGTLAAQWLGFMLAASIIVLRYDIIICPLRELFSLKFIGRFFRINSDIFLRTLCLVGVTIWFTRVGAQQGDITLAVNALLMQFFTLFSFFMDGLGYAGEAIAGKYIGAGNRHRLNASVRRLCHWGFFVAAIFTLIYIVGGNFIVSLLSDNSRVVASAAEFIPWVVTIPAAGFLAFTWDGIFIGATATRHMLLSMIAATTAFFSIYLLTFPLLGNHGLWLAFITYLATRSIVLSIVGRRRYTF